MGGNNKVEMKRLREVFENSGMEQVTTYINSGNVIFESCEIEKRKIMEKLEHVIEEAFGFEVKVLVINENELSLISSNIPANWANNEQMKCDVMFLWKEVDDEKILASLQTKVDVDEVIYEPGAVIWKVNRKVLGKSQMLKLVGTKLYRQMTIRNCNTVRKLVKMMNM